jgi:peptidoglycan/LPS O-acetylase OafA/YrhL
MQIGQKHIADLDALRGLAIILVVAFHAQEFLAPGFAFLPSQIPGFFWSPSDVGWQRFLLNISPTALGWSGVDLFLLLSGFLIHWSTLNRSSKFSLMDFYQRRFWRIYPTYLFVLVVFIFILGPFSIRDMLSHLLLIHNYDALAFYSINGSLWSLALEAQMYLLYPVLLKLNGSKGFGRSVILVGFISVVGMLANWLCGPWGPVYNSSLLRLWIIWVVGAYLAERHYQGRPVFRRHLLVGLLLLAVIPVLNISVLRPYFLRYVLLLFFALLLERVLVRGITSSSGKEGLRVWSFIFGGLVFLGTCSYSMYLIHQPILRWSIRFLNEWDIIGGKWFGLILIMLLITTASHVLYKFLELPSMRLGRNFFQRSTKSA